MRPALLTPALLCLATLALPATAMAGKSPPVSGEEKLAKMLEGRSAGKAEDCINQQLVRNTRIINRTAIVYEMNNGTYYVNRPTSGANFLRDDLILVTSTHNMRLCSIDVVRLVENGQGMAMGSAGLGKFIPYPRPAKAK